jgi:RNA polymerase sigma-70 factor (ECF subfamily)
VGAAIRQLVGESARNHPLTDEEVIERVRAGDTALFEVLMRRHNRRIYRVARAIVKDESEVEDVMQQTYVSAYTHLDQFAGAARFATWLTKIAVNEALARLRQSARLVKIDENFDPGEEGMKELASDASNPERRAASRELGGLLESSIDQLSHDHRTIFLLREVEGLSTAETAECLGISEELVKVRLHRAKSRLREHIFARVGKAATAAFEFYAPRCDRVVASVFERIDMLDVGVRGD